MDNIFDLRDVGFREYFINFSIANCVLSLKKEEISDKDLIRFYLEYSNLCDKHPLVYDNLMMTLFNYKKSKITEERHVRFEKIIKEKTGMIVFIMSYSALKGVIYNDEVFNELVDIFLDEI